jgi:hypothetical protein
MNKEAQACLRKTAECGHAALQTTDESARLLFAESAVIEIARVRMVEGVAVSPEIVGRQCQHASDTSDPVIRETTAEE